MRVLLFSPLAGRDPDSGDTVYTKSLIDHPPDGVIYTTYAEALDAGTVTIRGRRPKHGSRSVLDVGIGGLRAIELGLRRSGLMFCEPTWFVTIDETAFDLVHQHLFALRQVKSRVPVVTSAGLPLPVLYAEREQWSRPRLAMANGLENAFRRSARIDNPWIACRAGNLMTVYSEHFADYLIHRGVAADSVSVCGTALPDEAVPPRCSNGTTLGFVGRDFRRKGGDLVLQAFDALAGRHPDLRLRIVTTSAARSSIGPLGSRVDAFFDEPNTRVVGTHLPRIDILVQPTRADCGAPYGMLEAMRAGAAVVTSTSPWLDERLHSPGVVRVENDVAAVAAAIDRLLVPEVLSQAQTAARSLWREEFSMELLTSRLHQAYRQAAATPLR